MANENNTYRVELREGRSHYVVGLSDHDGEYADTLLMYRYREGDLDTRMKNAEMMLGALYDLYQCSEVLREGDRFVTEFGVFACVGVHVVPVEREPADDEPAQPRKYVRRNCERCGKQLDNSSEYRCWSCFDRHGA